MPATMRDVARQAGVSIKTVSRVVNNQGEISETTRQRVLSVISELGYRPSRLARALVTQQTHTLGLVVSDITNPYFPEMARGVIDAAQAREYNVFVCNTDGNPLQECNLLESLADHGVDGIIIYPTYSSDDNLKTFVTHYQPVVIVNYNFKQVGASQIMVDHRRGVKLAVDYLVGKGHTAIAMLTGVQAPSLDQVRRIQGFREALTAHQLPVKPEWIVPGQSPTIEWGCDGTKKLLKQYPQVTAIFAYNDLLAIGALQACRELRRRVPEDCAIIGFDDIIWAAQAIPPLTTIRVDKYNLGQTATQRLLEMLGHPADSFEPIYLDVALVVRETT